MVPQHLEGAVALDEAHDDDVAMLGLQLRERRQQDAAVDGEHRVRLDVLARCGLRDELVDREGLFQRARPVDRGVARDPVEERDERKPALLVSVDRVQRLHEDIRREVLGVVRGPRSRQAVAIDRVAVALVELTERGGVTGLRGTNERFIGPGPTSCEIGGARPA